MGKPILGEHAKLEVIIEESYEFKVWGREGNASTTLNNIRPLSVHVLTLQWKSKVAFVLRVKFERDVGFAASNLFLTPTFWTSHCFLIFSKRFKPFVLNIQVLWVSNVPSKSLRCSLTQLWSRMFKGRLPPCGHYGASAVVVVVVTEHRGQADQKDQPGYGGGHQFVERAVHGGHHRQRRYSF